MGRAVVKSAVRLDVAEAGAFCGTDLFQRSDLNLHMPAYLGCIQLELPSSEAQEIGIRGVCADRYSAGMGGADRLAH
jgi:hypothetical protein